MAGRLQLPENTDVTLVLTGTVSGAPAAALTGTVVMKKKDGTTVTSGGISDQGGGIGHFAVSDALAIVAGDQGVFQADMSDGTSDAYAEYPWVCIVDRR